MRISHLGNTSRPKRYTEEQIALYKQEKEAGLFYSDIDKKYSLPKGTAHYFLKKKAITCG